MMEMKCPSCGFARQIPDHKIPAKAEMATCPKCKNKFRFRTLTASESESAPEKEPGMVAPEGVSQVQPESKNEIWNKLESMDEEGPVGTGTVSGAGSVSGSDEDARGDEVPWENLDEYGFFPGFFQTIKRVMLHPVIFFSGMPLGRGIAKPLVFYLLLTELQALVQFALQMTGVMPLLPPDMAGAAGFGAMGISSLLFLVLYPLLLTVMLFMIVGINHLCLIIVRAADGGFEGTFRAVTYGAAPMILAMIPIIGALIGGIWTMVTTFFGYKYTHQTTTMKIVLAMLLPLFFFTVLATGMIFLGNSSGM